MLPRCLKETQRVAFWLIEDPRFDPAVLGPSLASAARALRAIQRPVGDTVTPVMAPSDIWRSYIADPW